MHTKYDDFSLIRIESEEREKEDSSLKTKTTAESTFSDMSSPHLIVPNKDFDLSSFNVETARAC